MGWRDAFDRTRYRPREGETRLQFLRRVSASGLPSLGWADLVRPLLWEVTREVTSLRDEVEALRAEVAELRAAQE